MKRNRLLNKKRKYHYSVSYVVIEQGGLNSQTIVGSCSMSDSKRWLKPKYDEISQLIKDTYYNSYLYEDDKVVITSIQRL